MGMRKTKLSKLNFGGMPELFSLVKLYSPPMNHSFSTYQVVSSPCIPVSSVSEGTLNHSTCNQLFIVILFFIIH